MINLICNKCGREITGSTYYTVNIYGHDINPTNDNRVSYTTAMQNVSTNMSKLFETERHYCEDCKIKVEEFIGKNN